MSDQILDQIDDAVESEPVIEEAVSEAAEEVTESPNPGTGELEAEVKAESGLTPTIEGEVKDAVNDIVNEGQAEGKTNNEIKKDVREYLLKVNGKEFKKKVDPDNDVEMIKTLQLAELGRIKAQEAADKEKALRDMERRLKDDPMAMLKDAGHDPLEWAEKLIQDAIEKEKMSPEEQKIAEQERMIQELLEKEEARKQEEERKKQEEQESKLRQQEEQDRLEFENQIKDVMSASKILPNNEDTFHIIANDMLHVMRDMAPEDLEAIMKNTGKNLAELVIPSIEERHEANMRKYFEESPLEVAERLIGEKLLEKQRKARLAKAKQTPQPSEIKEVIKDADPLKPKRRSTKLNDFLKNI